MLTCAISDPLPYLIIGQGLAGSILGCLLEEREIPFRVYDDPSRSSCSLIASGVYNPVSLKRMILVNRATEALPFAESFYRGQEELCGKKLFHETGMVKFFGEEKEREYWKGRADGALKGYISPEIHQGNYLDSFRSPFGYSRILRAGYLDVPLFLAETRRRWRQRDWLQDHADGSYKMRIFCEGHLVTKNPDFGFVRMKPVKGETLTLRISGLGLKEVVNKGVYLAPAGNDLYKAGSTYEWEELNEIPTLRGRASLEEKLSQVLLRPYEVLDHKAAVRPAVLDRSPVLGVHPLKKNLAIFNGLGTRGVLIGPWYANVLLEFLLGRGEIPDDVNVRRFAEE